MSGLTDEQLAYRRRYVCGSDAAEVMAGRWADLWQIKTGRMQEPDLYDKLSPTLDYFVLKHFTRERLELTRLLGHATEPLNQFWYTQQTGRVVERRSEWATSDEYPWMGAHLDGVTTTSRGHLCYWDAKWTGRADEAFLLRHTPQGVHNATIIGADWWGLSVFIGNGKWEWIEQQVDPLYQARLIAAEREFRGFVERDEEPEDRTEPTPAPKPQPKRREILLDRMPASEKPNWAGEFSRLGATFAGTHAAATAHAIARKALIELVPEEYGLVQQGLLRFKRDGRGVTLTLDKPEDDKC
jgi:hypothetical protein